MAEPPRMTPRLREVLAELYRGERPELYRSAADVAERSGVPLGTTQPLLARLETHAWAESRLEGGARRYRLTEAGWKGAAEEFDEEHERTFPDAVLAEEARASTALDRGDDGGTVSVGPVKVGKATREWGRMSDLDPALAEIVRAKIAAGEYTDE